MTQAERDEIRALVLSFSTKISDLPEVEALQDGDYVVVVQNDGSKKHSKKATLDSLLELIKVYYPDHNGAKYQGVAHPSDSNIQLPVGTDGFWFAIDAGVYTNYGGITVENAPKAIFYNVETHQWSSQDLWGDINGSVAFRLVEGTAENSFDTFEIPVVPGRNYIISANARPTGSFATLTIYEYSYDGTLVHSTGYHVPEHGFVPQSGVDYIKVTLGYNSSNPIDADISEVRVTSSIRNIAEAVTNFVVDVLQGTYAKKFSDLLNVVDSGFSGLTLRLGGVEARMTDAEGNINVLQVDATGMQADIRNAKGDINQLQIDATGITERLENAEGDIYELNVTAEGLDSRVTNAQGDIDELSYTADGLRQRITNAEGDIHTLESTATTLESNIRAVDGRVSILRQDVGSIEATVISNTGDIAGLAVEAHRIDLYAQSVNTNLGNYETYANSIMAGLQEQLDGAIDTYFYDYMPVHVDATGAPDSQVPLIEVTVGGVTIPCEPYASWYATDEGGTAQEVNTERLKHLGDVFYDNKSGYAFRFSNTGTADSPIFAWAVITDSAVIRALADAARAQDTADHKRRVFVYSSSYPTPYAPYDVGDLWVKPVTVGTGASAQSTTELYRCKTAREKTTNTFPFNPAVNTDTTSSGCDWEIADGYGTIVNKANLEILSDAIIGSVSQTTFDYENGIITSQCSSTIRQTANEIKLAISNGAIDTAVAANGKINKPLLDTGIDITNGNIVLTANHIALKNQNDQTGLELVTVGEAPNQRVVINTGSLNVGGIFTTSEWLGTGGVGGEKNAVLSTAETNAENYANSSAYLNGVIQGMIDTSTSGLAIDSDYSYLKTALENQTTALGGLMLTSLIQLGATQSGSSWTVNSGISGIYDSTKTGYGMAAWYGGPMVDWADLTASERLTTPHAKTAFRMDGSGYLADGAISWGAAGDLHLLNNIYIGPGTTDPFSDYLTLLSKLATWFEDEEIVIDNVTKHVLRINMSGDTHDTGFAGVVFNGFLITGGDQIVMSGTPGGGGGGAGYLYELKDTVSTWTAKPSVSATQVLVFDPQATDKNSNTGAWKYVPATDIGRVYSGGTGITINPNTNEISVTANTYAPYYANGYVKKDGDTMSGDLSVPHLNITNLGGADEITFARDNYNYIRTKTSGGRLGFITDGKSMVGASVDLAIGPGWASVNNGVTAPSYNFYVNGTLNATTIYQNGTTLANTYLSLAGGTISGINNSNLGINNAGGGTASYITFKVGGTTKAYVGFGATEGLFLQEMDGVGNPYVNLPASATTLYWKNSNPFYHSGNSNKSDVNWTAQNLTAAYAHLGNGDSVTNLELFGSTGVAIGFYKSGTRVSLLYSSGDAPFQRYNGDWSTGYTIYDSGNANKSDVAWTASTFACINGTDGGYFIKDTGGTNRRAMYLDSANNFGIGYGTANVGYSTYLDGNAVYIRYGTSHSTGITLNSSGNVGIGTSSPAYKLDVRGTSASYYMEFFGTDGTTAVGYVGRGSSLYNTIYLSSYSNGNIAIMPNGTGNVGIGTASPGYKLDVVGIIHTDSNVELYEALRMNRNSYCFICAMGASSAISFNVGGSSSSYSKMLINNNGNVSIGYFGDGSSKLYVAGAITSTGDQVISSDERLKTIVKPVDMTVEQLAGMRAVIYDRKDSGVRSLGVIAQDWEKVLPESVNQGEYLTFKYAQTAMVSAIVLAKHETEQDKEIRKLKARVKDLEKQLKMRS